VPGTPRILTPASSSSTRFINVVRGSRALATRTSHWSEVFAAPRQLARELKIGIMFVHHARKSGKQGEVDAEMSSMASMAA
jgi:RecA-family ATPase